MTEKRFVYMNLLETEAISVSDDECYYFNEYGTVKKICKMLNALHKENEQLKQLIKKVLETTPIEHSLAIDLKNSIRELYE